jgi:hypothetical protein
LDEKVAGRLARFLAGRRRGRQEARFLKQWTGSETVLRYLFALESRIAPAQGSPASPGARPNTSAARDLYAIYADNNNTYFSGALTPPRQICWSRRSACCRTGYYNPMNNSITISRALSAPEVPEFIVAFVLYHEMLHQESRLTLLGGQGRVHDKAFREAERKFSRYAEAVSWLKRLAEEKRISPD